MNRAKLYAKLMNEYGKDFTRQRIELMYLGLREYANREHTYYHNVDHGLRVMETYAQHWGCRSMHDDACLMALAWHDAVYIVGFDKNEEASALLFRNAYKRQCQEIGIDIVTDSWMQRVSNMIEATKVAVHLSDDTFEDGMIDRVLDCDLVGLSDEWPVFLKTQDKILREHFVSIPELPSVMEGMNLQEERAQQAEFLKAFLEKRDIYRTLEFRRQFEPQAQANIRKFIELYGTW